ncbi:MAG: hypothetical protein ACLPVF_13855 [Acidimicrobiales bacterium]
MIGGRRTAVGAAIAAVAATVTLLLPGVDRPTSASPRPAATADSSANGPGARTLAGTGIPGFNGDRRAVDAELDAPAGIAVDGRGDLFIADEDNCRVREVPARTGTAFGRRVHAGDIVTLTGGSCRAVQANPAPSAVAVDAAGDVFIAYATAARVEELPARSTTSFGRRVTAGRLTVVAGTGVPGFSGDGGPAGRAALDEPSGLAVDATGDLLISDTANCRVRLVAASDGTRFGVPMRQGHIYTVAGNGICGSSGDGGPALSAEIWDPGALAVDRQGDVLVADQGNRSIRVLTSHAGTFYGVPLAADDVGTVAGEGSYGPYLVDGLPAVFQTGEINFPTGLAVGADGDIFIADGAMHAIRLVPDVPTPLRGLVAQPDDIYILAGALSTGMLHHHTTWVQTRMSVPTGLAFSPGGQLVYSDAEANVVRELPVSG